MHASEVLRDTLLPVTLAVALADPGTAAGAGAGGSSGFAGPIQQQDLDWRPLDAPGLPAGLRARVLGGSGGSVTMVVSYPAGWARPRGYYTHDLETYVLDGDLSVGDRALTVGHYANLPAGWANGPVGSRTGATVLHLSGGPLSFTVSGQSRVDAHEDEVILKEVAAEDWAISSGSPPGGRPIPLLVKHLRRQTGTAATWLVAVTKDMHVPWESDTTSKEGYLLEGDHTLSECLEDGVRTATYRPGGYFYRPPGLLHGGPASGTRTYAIWLMHAPRAAEVRYQDSCPTERPH